MLEPNNVAINIGVGMDANTQAPATDDQELAKVLESMNSATTSLPAADPPTASGLQFEEAAPAPVDASLPNPVTADPAPAVPAPEPIIATPEPVIAPLPPVETAVTPELESIKQDALQELRPLVDKLDLPPEEKFNTLLLIIRSTDDKSLVAQAHAAAKSIEDESKRAEALLDVIKEIDYFSHPQA